MRLKHGVSADLTASAVPVTDPKEKRRLVTLSLQGLEAMGGWARASGENIAGWTVGSPLVEIDFGAS